MNPRYLTVVALLTLLAFAAASAVVAGAAAGKSPPLHSHVTALTGLPDIARSTTYLEPRLERYKDLSLKLYPQRDETGYMDFVYAP